jgi:hypothetical protein
MGLEGSGNRAPCKMYISIEWKRMVRFKLLSLYDRQGHPLHTLDWRQCRTRDSLVEIARVGFPDYRDSNPRSPNYSHSLYRLRYTLFTEQHFFKPNIIITPPQKGHSQHKQSPHNDLQNFILNNNVQLIRPNYLNISDVH